MKPTSLGEERHLGIGGIEPDTAQFLGVLRRPQAVLGIVMFILPSAVMDDREELDDLEPAFPK